MTTQHHTARFLVGFTAVHAAIALPALAAWAAACERRRRRRATAA